MKERKVIHLFQDSRGNISKTQSYFGIQEITDIYDNANTESEQELEEKGREKLEDAYAAANSMEVTFKSMKYTISEIMSERQNDSQG